MTDYSFQLYSARNFTPWSAVFSMLGKLGYTQVEGFDPVYDEVEEVVPALAHAGLSMPTGHFSLDMLEQDPEKVLSLAAALGMQAIYCPYLPPEHRPSDAGGYRSLGERLQAAGQFYTDAGLIYGWHNHDFEFQPLADGSLPLQHIFEGGPELSWEADIAWIIRGGADPYDWIKREGQRISAVHIKDLAPAGECEDEDGWADVGHGTLDWPGILSALELSPVKYFIMEHDNPSDAERFAQRSIEFCNAVQGEDNRWKMN